MKILIVYVFTLVAPLACADELLKLDLTLDQVRVLHLKATNVSEVDLCVFNEQIPQGGLEVDVLDIYDDNGNLVSEFLGIEPSLITDTKIAKIVKYFKPMERLEAVIDINEYYNVEWARAKKLTYGVNIFPCGNLDQESYLEFSISVNGM
ncbi:hypothetical protein [Microbulbifer sp. TRSA005]|uniref:hypothetical protein n=1 Tax=Microbulbifer sp. TRSA005 TaxID=3243383 RepID=UPI00403A1C55